MLIFHRCVFSSNINTREVYSMTQAAIQLTHKHSLVYRFLFHLKKYWMLHLMTLPTVLYLLVFCYAPMFGTLIAFQNFNISKGFFSSEFVGLKNFEFMFTTSEAWSITRNTVLYNVAFIVINTTLSMSLALLFSELYSRKLAKTMQTLLIMPYFLSMAVVALIVLGFLTPGKYGYFNKIVTFFGGEPQMNWYLYKPLWPGLLILVNAWRGVGYSSIVYMATISGISEEYYEAAVLDGATKWQQARYVTIPHLRQILIIMFILNIGSLFRGDFGLFYTVTQNNGALYEVTDVIDTYVYRSLTVLRNTGMAAAVGLYQSIVGFVLIMVANFIIRKVDSESALF